MKVLFTYYFLTKALQYTTLLKILETDVVKELSISCSRIERQRFYLEIIS